MKELEMILAAVADLGEIGAWLYGAYLAKHLIIVFVVCGAVVFTVRFLIKVIAENQEHTKALSEIRDLWGLGDGWLSSKEVRRVLNKANEYKEKVDN